MNLAEMLAAADAATEGVEVSSGDFSLITPGTYSVAITGAEGPIASKSVNPANPSEHGQLIKIECTITGPSFVGRKVWMNNNILVYPKDDTQESAKNAQKAMSIGAKERKVMLESLGKSGIQSASELVGATFEAVIATEKGKNGYADKSVIKTVKSTNGTTPAKTTQPNAESEKPTQTNKSKLPWDK